MSELDEYKTNLRKVLIRVAAEESYCDSGLNDVLEELDLAPKRTFYVKVRLTSYEQTFKVPVHDAQTQDEARALLEAGDDQARQIIKSYYGSFSGDFEVVPPPVQPAADSGVPLPGQPNPGDGEWYATSVTSGGPNQCRVRAEEDTNLYCTRPLDHAADWHVAAGKNAGVLEVWQAKEGDVRPDTAPPMPATESFDFHDADGVEDDDTLAGSPHFGG